jgi:Fe-Mn family superoxide dismutase
VPHELPPLPYDYSALEPHYDEATLRLHHDKHHNAYVVALNAAEQKLANARQSGDFATVQGLERQIAFNGAGHQLHSIFWTNMKKDGGGRPKGSLLAQIVKDFGTYEGFMAQFKAAATTVEGSGWGVLALYRTFKKLEVLAAMNHQNQGQWDSVPLLVCDVWEHAYYLKYQNLRPNWVAAFVDHLVNWDDVAERFERAL